jgi:curved DNA-binding protein
MLAAMSSDPGQMDIRRARDVLRLPIRHGPAELRRAFREAAKRAHPDRPGGDPDRFREAVLAFHVLQAAEAERGRRVPPPAGAVVLRPASGVGSTTLSISPLVAMAGGQVEHVLPDGRRIRISAPPGLRAGDVVRAGGERLEVAVRGDGTMLVRGDDLWINVAVDPRLLAEGGRVGVETPLGRRVVWITKKAGERGLLRLVGQGLPARGRWREGHLFLRLTPLRGTVDSAARTLLRRFTAAWAA